MGEKTAGPFHNPRWPEVPKPEIADPPSPLISNSAFSHPIDESPELHDPYSDLNLFLARKVKEEFKHAGTTKKWSFYTQEKLIEKIAPEFRKRFPHYRLGVAALKKVWEKFAYFSQTFENQKEALTQEGKLNVGFLIRENLKQFLGGKKSFSFHPYLLAQQLALKISECLASYDGIRPMLQHITKTIWAVERHLIPPSHIPNMANPYDEFDTWDKLIIKFMLEASGKDRHLSQEELQAEVRQSLYSLQDLPTEALTNEMASLLTKKLSRTMELTAEEQQLLQSLPSRQRIEDETGHILIDNPYQTIHAAVQTALQFFKKAKQLTATANWIEIEHKITLWTIQGDLVYRFLRIEDNRLLQLIREKGSMPAREIIQEYLSRHPILAHFSSQMTARVRILSRYAWYAISSTPAQSTADRFFEWHLQKMNGADAVAELEKLCKKQLPLLPFDRKQAEILFSKYQKQSEKNERNTEQLPHR